MRDAALLALAGGFASGILCRSFFVFPGMVLLFLALLAMLSSIFWCFYKRPLYLWCALALIGCALGIGRVMMVSQTLPGVFVQEIGKTSTFEGVVTREPDIRETTQRITISVQKDTEKTKMLVVAPLYPEIVYGETIQVTGTLTRPEPFSTDTGRVFRYDQFLAKDGIFTVIERASVESVSPPQGIQALVMGTLLSFKKTFQEGLGNALPEPAASLASGLITGGKQGLGKDLLDAFIVAGLVHIVVLSGYNVMIIAEGVLRSLRFLSKKGAALAAGVLIALFVLAAGAGAASIRAGVMAGLALLARATGRTYAVLRALVVAALVMLIANPLLLAFDPGFQLSFLATYGLIVGAPIVALYLVRVRSIFWRELLAATIAAQIAVLPLLLYQTGLFSVVSLPANLFVLPVVPLAMATSAFAGLIGMLFPALAPVIGVPAYLLLSYILWIAEFSSALPIASFALPQFPFVFVLVAYGGLLFWIARNHEKGPVVSSEKMF